MTKGRSALERRTWGDVRGWYEVWGTLALVAIGFVLAVTEVIEIPALALRVGLLISGVLFFARAKRGRMAQEMQLIDDEIDAWHRRFLPWGVLALILLIGIGIWAQSD